MRYTTLIDATGSIIWIDFLRPEGARRSEELLGHKFWEFLEPADRQCIEQAFADAAWRNQSGTGEARLRVGPVEFSFSPVTAGDSTLIMAHISTREEPEEPLTQRETEILKLLCCDMTPTELSAQLGIAASTVDSHAANIRRKLGVRGLAGMVRAAIRARLVTP